MALRKTAEEMDLRMIDYVTVATHELLDHPRYSAVIHGQVLWLLSTQAYNLSETLELVQKFHNADWSTRQQIRQVFDEND